MSTKSRKAHRFTLIGCDFSDARRLKTSVQLPICRRWAIHLSVIVVSFRNRFAMAIFTLCSFRCKANSSAKIQCCKVQIVRIDLFTKPEARSRKGGLVFAKPWAMASADLSREGAVHFARGGRGPLAVGRKYVTGLTDPTGICSLNFSRNWLLSETTAAQRAVCFRIIEAAPPSLYAQTDSALLRKP